VSAAAYYVVVCSDARARHLKRDGGDLIGYTLDDKCVVVVAGNGARPNDAAYSASEREDAERFGRAMYCYD
jgi:hypothetical protein